MPDDDDVQGRTARRWSWWRLGVVLLLLLVVGAVVWRVHCGG